MWKSPKLTLLESVCGNLGRVHGAAAAVAPLRATLDDHQRLVAAFRMTDGEGDLQLFRQLHLFRYRVIHRLDAEPSQVPQPLQEYLALTAGIGQLGVPL